MLDLMWKYYDKQRNYTAAARILAKLAEKHRYWGRALWLGQHIGHGTCGTKFRVSRVNRVGVRVTLVLVLVLALSNPWKCAENYNKWHSKFIFLTAISILPISNHNSFRVLFDKIASIYFICKIYLYFSIGNGQPREPELCQLYRHTFVLYGHLSDCFYFVT